MALVTSEHLQQLASTTNGQIYLGELMRRLIHNWVPRRINGMGFHAGSSNNLPGWDGWLQLNPDAEYPQPFYSVWEVSVRKDSVEKIRSDFAASIGKKIPPSWDFGKTTYVAVTLRRVAERLELQEELRNSPGNVWGDVQIVDAPALEQWIEKCPAVEAWCAERLGIGNSRFGRSLTRFWHDWSISTRPPMTMELVLAGRPPENYPVIRQPEKGTAITLQFDEPHEGAAYIYAALQGTEDFNTREGFTSVALVIDNVEAAKRYAIEIPPPGVVPITILIAPANTVASHFVENGHFVINLIGRSEVTRGSYHTVSRALYRDLAEALEKTMKFSHEDAVRDARAAGGSVSAWAIWNRIDNSTFGDQLPEWAEKQHIPVSVPAAICGGWDEQFSGDSNALEQLTELEYKKVSAALTPLLRQNSPLLERTGSILKVVAPTVAFLCAVSHLTEADLIKYAELLQRVFVSEMPKVELLENESPYPPSSTPSNYSEWITRGLAETILRLSAFAEYVDKYQIAHSFGGCQEYVTKTLAPIANHIADPQFLAAFENQLPFMMEAAPEPFLDVLELSTASALQDVRNSWRLFFKDRGVWRQPHHLYVLSGLGVLCWSPEYFERAVLLLSHFSMLERLNKSRNNSSFQILLDVFRAENPATSADVEMRIAGLRNIAENYDDLAWELCKKLLPARFTTLIGATRFPIWKDFGRSERVSNRQSYAESYRQYAEFTLEMCSEQPQRQLELLKAYTSFSSSDRNKFREQLIQTANDMNLDSKLRAEFWSSLSGMVSHHRKYRDTNWSLDDAEVQNLEGVAQRFESLDAFGDALTLLNSSTLDIDDGSASWEDADRNHNARRIIAVRNLIESGSIFSLIELANKAKNSLLAADIITRTLSSDESEKLIALCATSKISDAVFQLLSVLSFIRHAAEGPSWISKIAKKANQNSWSEEVMTACLIRLPMSHELKEFLDSGPVDISSQYWKQRHFYFVRDVGFEDYIAEKLIENKRAIDLLNQSLTSLRPTTAIEVISAFTREVLADKHAQQAYSSIVEHNLQNALTWLREDSTVRRLDIASLEYPLIAILNYSELKSRPVLHEFLSDEPMFFVEVLCDAYLPDDTPEDRPEPTEIQLLRARAAWQLLDGWKSPPGITNEGSFDETKLKSWIEAVRTLTKEYKRFDIGDDRIGRILFYVPSIEKNGTISPPEFLCEIIENAASVPLEDGFRIEAFNSRGVSTRPSGEGGEQERALAKRWRNSAKAIKPKWGRVKALYMAIAEGWEEDAKRMDYFADVQRLRQMP